VPLVLPERSGGKGHRLSPAFSMSDAKGERIEFSGSVYVIRWNDWNDLLGTSSLSIKPK